MCDIETLAIERLLNSEHFYGKIMPKMCTKKLAPDPFLILLNNPKKTLHAGNSFESMKF